MQLAIISDVHVGDEWCQLVTPKADGTGYRLGEYWPKLRQELAALGKIDYLILLGDILDFSVTSYGEAYKAGRVFFRALKRLGTIKKLVYVPGNHDLHVWNMTQYQESVIGPLSRGRNAKPIAGSRALFLDDRSASRGAKHVELGDTVSASAPKRSAFMSEYTGIPTIVAFPNVYVVSEGHTCLITHGQYMSGAWVFLSELALARFHHH